MCQFQEASSGEQRPVKHLMVQQHCQIRLLQLALHDNGAAAELDKSTQQHVGPRREPVAVHLPSQLCVSHTSDS